MAVIFHYAEQAVCYLPLLVFMVIVLLYSPALAVWPRLTQTPFLFAITPLISISLLVSLAFALFHLGYYQHNIIFSFSLGIFIIAVIRQYRYRLYEKPAWRESEKALFIINLAIVLPLIAMSALSAFMIDDALASWNYWAKHYVHQLSPASVSVGYPLAFPYFLSYCYQFLGTTEYQGAVKALLVVIPFTLLNIFAFRFARKPAALGIYLCIALISIFPGFLDIDFYRFYSLGYADPLLAAAVTVSAALLLSYCESEQKLLLLFGVITAVTASLTKQPGFLWALASFPLILMIKMLKHKAMHWFEAAAIVVVIIPALLWITGPGRHFQHNTGVLTASLGTSHITALVLLKTLWHSVLTYWIQQPSLLLLYVLAAFSLKTGEQKALFIGFILPGTILWFLFGAYDIREGLYLLTCCGLLVTRQMPENKINLKTIKNIFLAIGIILFIFFSLREQNVQRNGVEDHLYPLEASKTLIYHYFSTGAPIVYQDIFSQPDQIIGTENIFVRGIFFGHNPLTTETLDARPDYFITSGQFHTPSDAAILAVHQACPFLLAEIPLGQPLYQIRLFRYSHSIFAKQRCDKRYAGAINFKLGK